MAQGALASPDDDDPSALLGGAGGSAWLQQRTDRAEIVVVDPAMRRLHELVGLVAQSSLPVLVVGETGVGKEIVASAVHERSTRASKPLVRVNCASVPEQLLESELFGYERGAFTGATRAKPGLIESAAGSTFFLDEIGELPPATQAKLLRVLESGEVMRLSALAPRTVDVRFVAATNRDLGLLVTRGAFRPDLYFRLNGITVVVPPLRERPTEVRELAKRFLSEGAARLDRTVPRLSGEAIAALERHPWPGNVRELHNVIERALAIGAPDVIGPEAIILDPPDEVSMRSAPTALVGSSTATSRGAARGRLVRADGATEQALILEALDAANGNQSRAADILGVSRRTLINRLEEYGMPRPRKR